MHVRVEVGQVAEGLHEQEPRGDAAQFPQPRALALERGPQELWHGEHVLQCTECPTRFSVGIPRMPGKVYYTVCTNCITTIGPLRWLG